MDYKALLEKYWEGQTSLEEEKSLKAYFKSGKVDDALKPYASMFEYFEKEKSVELSTDFDDKILSQIQEDGKEVNAKVFSIQRILMRVAAVGLLVLASWFVFDNANQRNQVLAVEDTYEHPEEAYAEAKAALVLLSKTLNKGKKSTTRSLKKIEKAKKILK